MASLRGGSGKQRAEAIVLNTLWGIRETRAGGRRQVRMTYSWEEGQVNKEQRP